MEEVELPSYICHAGSCLIICGPTKSGKSTVLSHIIKERNHFYSEKCDSVVICYKEYQELYDQIKATDPYNITFFYGMPNETDLEGFIKQANNKYLMLVFDDLISQASDSDLVQNILVHISHHKKVNLIQISQNIFEKGKHARTQSLNYSGFILMRTTRDLRQVSFLGSQIFPGKNRSRAFMAAYDDAMERPLTKYTVPYMFIDTSPRANRQFQLQSNIFPIQGSLGRVIYRV